MKRIAPAKPRILEKHVEEAVCNFLEIDGWRSLKQEQNFSDRKVKVTGERGMPDRLFIRYTYPPGNSKLLAGHTEYSASLQAMCGVIWIEFKAPGKLPRPEQTAWHATERALGALVMVVDSYDDFRRWYLGSGLARRVGGKAQR